MGNKKRGVVRQQVEVNATIREINKEINPKTGANSNSGNNNSKEQQREDMNEKLSHFNVELCPGKLGGNDDTTDIEDLQSFSINITF